MYGPPGCGKTLIAKAIANETGAYFVKINGPEVMKSKQGETEAEIRAKFEEAKENAPAILFIGAVSCGHAGRQHEPVCGRLPPWSLTGVCAPCGTSDEIDCLAPNRKDSGTVMQRVTTQLLTCMNGFDDNEHVVVIGATNRPNSLDPALRCVRACVRVCVSFARVFVSSLCLVCPLCLVVCHASPHVHFYTHTRVRVMWMWMLMWMWMWMWLRVMWMGGHRRRGRFDEELVIPVPSESARVEILTILARKQKLAKDVNLEAIAHLTHGYVGADLSNLCMKAAINCIRRHAAGVLDLEEDDIPDNFLRTLEVTMDVRCLAVPTCTAATRLRARGVVAYHVVVSLDKA